MGVQSGNRFLLDRRLEFSGGSATISKDKITLRKDAFL